MGNKLPHEKKFWNILSYNQETTSIFCQYLQQLALILNKIKTRSFKNLYTQVVLQEPINTLCSCGNIHMHIISMCFSGKGCIFLTMSHFQGSVLFSLYFGRTTHASRSRIYGKCNINSEGSKHIFPFSAVVALNIKSYIQHE